MNISAVEILFVEDNPHDAELALRALTKHKLANKLLHVKDGAEALQYIFSTGAYSDRRPGVNPRLVLLDLMLPKVDGMEVLRRMKADERTRAIPVVILTSSSEERDIVEGYRLGVNSYIVKPVDFDKFLTCVRELGLYWLLLNQPVPSP